MKLKKLIACATLLAMFGSSVHNLNAQEFATNLGGVGYEQSRSAAALTPAIALGAVALVAIIAVAVQNSGHHHGHHHD